MKVAKVAAKKAKTVAKKAKTVAKPRVSAKKAKTNAKVAAKPKKYNIRGGVVGSSSRKSSPIQEETELEKEAERLNKIELQRKNLKPLPRKNSNQVSVSASGSVSGEELKKTKQGLIHLPLELLNELKEELRINREAEKSLEERFEEIKREGAEKLKKIIQDGANESTRLENLFAKVEAELAAKRNKKLREKQDAEAIERGQREANARAHNRANIEENKRVLSGMSYTRSEQDIAHRQFQILNDSRRSTHKTESLY
jgi:hypothetical protein